MEFWDAEKKKELISIDVPNTTQFEWAPDGQHFITAITTPRLRIDNCYRLWHYSGKLVNEVLYDSPKEELWQVKFRPMAGYNKFEVKEITKSEQLQAGLLIKKKDTSHPLNNLPAGSLRQQAAYVPPHLRKAGGHGSLGSSAAPVATEAEGNDATAVKPASQLTEQQKRMLFLQKKIREIEKLKLKERSGTELQGEQKEKITKLDEFTSELSMLNIKI